MRTKELNKISVAQSKHPASRFDLSFDCNTTSAWGDCQPVVCRMLTPYSKTTLKLDSLVRMAPLVRPAFARVKAKYWSTFVGMSDLIENFAPMLAQETVSRGTETFKPLRVPYTRLNELSMLVLFGAKMSVWEVYDNFSPNLPYTAYKLRHWDSSNPPSDEVINWVQGTFWRNRSIGSLTQVSNALGGYNGAWVDYGLILNPSVVPRFSFMPVENLSAHDFFDYGHSENGSFISNGEYVSLDGADYVVERDLDLTGSGGSLHHLAFAFRLSEFGKRLRKVLIGCGYQPNFNSDTEVSLMPLFAYYKAYWDTFGLTLYNKWETTNAYKVLTYYDFYNTPDFTNLWHNSLEDGSIQALQLNLVGFFSDLGQTWVTRDADWVSAHTETQSVASDLGFGSSLVDFNADLTNYLQSVNRVSERVQENIIDNGKQAYVYSGEHGQLDAEYLKALYKVINQNSIEGQRIAGLLRNQGLGDWVDSCESRFIGYREFDCKISEITSTSDSFNSSQNSGAVLGEQGGKSATYQDVKPLSYTNREFGYWITLMSIVPESGFCQSLDAANVKSIEKFDFYNPEFDGMGKRVTAFDEIVAQADWTNNPSTNPPQYGTDLKRGFGFIPQYTQFKVKNNVMNGDMSIRGVRNSYLQFTGDKFLEVGERKVLDSSDVGSNLVEKAYLSTPVAQLPIAGNAWRYPARYQFLGNFDRLFYNNNEAEKYNNSITLALASSNIAFGYLTWEMIRKTYDNFVVHNICDFVTYAKMLPLEDSFETLQEGNKGKPNAEVRKA